MSSKDEDALSSCPKLTNGTYSLWAPVILNELDWRELGEYVLDREEYEDEEEVEGNDAAERAAQLVAAAAVREVLRAKRATAQGRLGADFKKTKDAKAMALIKRAMLTEHLPLVAHCKTAQQLWEVIAAQFQSKGCTRRFELRQRMMKMVMDWQEGETIMGYIGRGMGLLNEMTAAGIHRDEEGMVMALLNGLPGTYNPMLDVIKTLTSTLEELTIEWITPYLRDRETEIGRQLESGLSPGGVVMFSGGDSAGQQVCYYCQKPGHIKGNCLAFQKHDPRGFKVYKERKMRQAKQQQHESDDEDSAAGTSSMGRSGRSGFGKKPMPKFQG